MDAETELSNFYTIVERWEEVNLLSTYLQDRKIPFKQRSSQSWQQDTKKSKGGFRTTVVYEAHLSAEDILCIKLINPDLEIIRRNYR